MLNWLRKIFGRTTHWNSLFSFEFSSLISQLFTERTKFVGQLPKKLIKNLNGDRAGPYSSICLFLCVCMFRSTVWRTVETARCCRSAKTSNRSSLGSAGWRDRPKTSSMLCSTEKVRRAHPCTHSHTAGHLYVWETKHLGMSSSAIMISLDILWILYSIHKKTKNTILSIICQH